MKTATVLRIAAATMPSVCASNAAEIAPRQKPCRIAYTMPSSAARRGLTATKMPTKNAAKLASQNPPGIVTVVFA